MAATRSAPTPQPERPPVTSTGKSAAKSTAKSAEKAAAKSAKSADKTAAKAAARSAGQSAVPSASITVERFTLANGLRVVLAPDRSAPVVGVNVTYDVGFRSEPEGRTGFAHLFEHLMFQGRKTSGRWSTPASSRAPAA